MGSGNNRNYNNNNYNNYNNNNNNQPKKKSGCTFKSGSSTKNGADCISGWNKSKTRGFITLVACPVRDGLIVSNKNGKDYEKWVATIKFARNFDEKTFTAFYDPDTKKLRIPDIQMTASPNSPNGGYFGGWSKK